MSFFSHKRWSDLSVPLALVGLFLGLCGLQGAITPVSLEVTPAPGSQSRFVANIVLENPKAHAIRGHVVATFPPNGQEVVGEMSFQSIDVQGSRYRAELLFPPRVPGGDWELSLRLVDKTDPTVTLTFGPRSDPPLVQLISIRGTTPWLSHLSFAPSPLDVTLTSSGGRSVSCEIQIGVDTPIPFASPTSFQAELLSPVGLRTISVYSAFQPSTIGRYSAKGNIWLSQGEEPGLWQLSRLVIWFSSGEPLEYGLAESGLAPIPAAFPKGLQVVNGGIVDVTDPVIEDIVLLTPEVDLALPNPAAQFRIRATDVGTGFGYAEVNVRNPERGFLTHRLSPSYVQTDPNWAALVFSFPQYGEPGNWEIRSIQLYDKAGNSTLVTVEAFPASWPTVIRTVNQGRIDLQPPLLTGLELLTPRIDLAQRTPVVRFRIKASDDVSGIDRVMIWLESVGEAVISYESSHAYWSSSTVDSDGWHVFEFSLDGFVPSRVWEVTSIRLTDRADREVYYSVRSRENPLPSLPRIETVNSGAVDLSPPEILAFEILTPEVDVANSDGFFPIVRFRIRVRDDVSGFRDAYVEARSASGIVKTGSIYGDEDQPDGEGWWEGNIWLDRFGLGETWEMTSISLSDFAGHNVEIPITSWPVGSSRTFQTLNAVGMDKEAPKLISISPHTQMVFGQEPSTAVTPTRFAFVASDDASGARYGELQLYQPNAPSSDQEFVTLGGFFEVYAREGQSNASTEMSGSWDDIEYMFHWAPGLYIWRLQLVDRSGKSRYYSRFPGDEPWPAGVPDTLEVINHGPVDLTAPVWTGTSIDKAEVDVTEFAQTVTLTVRATDDVGIDRIEGVFSNGDSSIDFDKYTEEKLPGIDPETWTIHFRVNGRHPPGRYSLSRMWLRDQRRRSTTYEADDGTLPAFARDLSFTVVNRQAIDSTDPVVVEIRQSHTRVDVSQHPQSVHFDILARDDESGVDDVRVELYDPRQFDEIQGEQERVSGSSHLGWYRETFTLSPATRPGRYVLDVSVVDEWGNDANRLGRPKVLLDVVNSVYAPPTDGPVAPAPELLGVRWAATEADVTNGPTTLAALLTFTKRDEPFTVSISSQRLLGADTYSPPVGRSGAHKSDTLTKIDETDTSITVSVPVSFRSGIGSGMLECSVWTWTDDNDWIYSTDGRSGSKPIPVPESARLSLVDPHPPITEELAPVIESLSVEHSVVDISAPSPEVAVLVRMTDTGWGFRWGTLHVRSAGRGEMWDYVDFDESHRISGSDLDGIYRVAIPVSKLAVPETWDIWLRYWSDSNTRFEFSGYPFYDQSPVVRVQLVRQTPYRQWLSTQSGLSGLAAEPWWDPDGDGRSNLEEMLFGGSPSKADSAGPSAPQLEITAEGLALRLPSDLNGIVLGGQKAPTLSGPWEELQVTADPSGQRRILLPRSDSQGYLRVSIHDPRETTPPNPVPFPSN